MFKFGLNLLTCKRVIFKYNHHEKSYFLPSVVASVCGGFKKFQQ